MKPRKRPTPKPRSPSRSSPERSAEATDWREGALARLRDVIRDADPNVIEEVKWRKPSNPEGVPVWSHDGMICIGNILKSAVRLTFPSGAQIRDPQKLFNARLESRTVRAIDFHEGEVVDTAALKALVLEAVRWNRSSALGR